MRVLTPQKVDLLLDKKDWRVLQEIVDNIRQPVSQIAKTTLLSRQSVEYRLKQLQEKGLLTGSRTVINVQKLGYRSYHVFLEVHTPSEEKKILVLATKADFVNAIIIYSGKYNLEISIQARTEEEFLEYYNRLCSNVRVRNDFILIILDTLVSQILPSRYFPQLGKKKTTEELPSKTSKDLLNTDATDLRILFALSQEALRSNISLAKELGVSKDTIQYRIRKLEEHRYIQGYRPVVNFAALGLTINTLLIKVNSLPQAAEFEKHLRAHGAVLWAAKVLGYYNYLVYVVSKNIDEFHEVINGMKEQFDDVIKTYEILFAFEELKYNFMAESIVKREK